MKKYRNSYIHEWESPCRKSILRSIAQRGYAYSYDIVKALKRKYSEELIKDELRDLYRDNRLIVEEWTNRRGEHWVTYQINDQWLNAVWLT